MAQVVQAWRERIAAVAHQLELAIAADSSVVARGKAHVCDYLALPEEAKNGRPDLLAFARAFAIREALIPEAVPLFPADAWDGLEPGATVEWAVLRSLVDCVGDVPGRNLADALERDWVRVQTA